MTTASTKRNRKKKRAGYVAPKAKPAEPTVLEIPDRGISDRTWFIAAVVILLVAAVLRLYDLDLVPLHHDEGVNGNFLTRLVREGIYHYDPENYHGPTIYYFSAFFPWLLRFLFGTAAQDKYGLNTITIRLVPALFGLATVWLVLLLRRRLGAIGALAAAALLAVSPGAVYLSRYYIHETLFVFFTLGLVIAALKYYEEAHPIYLMLAAISAALLFATKETAIISVGVLVIALAVTQGYRFIRRRNLQDRRTNKRSQRTADTEGKPGLLDKLGGPLRVSIWAAVAIAIFVGLNVLFYSSFFRNYPQGVYDSVRTFQFWSKTGKTAHVHPLTTYVYWMIRQESPILFLATIGAALVVWKPRNSFALFVALWGFGMLAAYSLISYKTPWLGLNFIIPLGLVAGYALQMIWERSQGQLGLIAGVLVAAIAISGYQTIDLNFFNYDNDDQYYVYVYAHTRRETLLMLKEIDRVVERTQQGAQTGITIVAPEYWPLPWYFRDFTRVGYNGRMSASTEPVIIAAESQGAEMESTFGQRYQQVNSGLNPAGTYPLRPGVNFLLYVRRDLIPGNP
ncbi:MAG TPA: flippase activity-associated protein Agl23 [Pyrinomonadaceae bacterium]|nr:flippase activity-associated protein Agl23 [Pyrinomonadaceae bacterium]